MARSARWAIANGLYHVMNRGVGRQDIVIDNDDRKQWMRLLDRVARRCEWRLYAYVLLDNHFHLFVRTPKPNLSSGMHALQSGYATMFNKRHSRSGALFQGRFKSILVESEGYCWAISRYVHLNPVRAKLVRDPANYDWCSYRYFLNPAGAPPWLDWRTVFAEFSKRESAARVAYKRFVEEAIRQSPASPFDKVVDGWLIGSQQFVDQMRDVAEDPVPESPVADNVTTVDIIQAVADAFDVTVESIQRRGGQDNAAREAVVWLLREGHLQPVVDVAATLGVGKSTISETFRRAVLRRNQDTGFRQMVDAILRQIQ